MVAMNTKQLPLEIPQRKRRSAIARPASDDRAFDAPFNCDHEQAGGRNYPGTGNLILEFGIVRPAKFPLIVAEIVKCVGAIYDCPESDDIGMEKIPASFVILRPNRVLKILQPPEHLLFR